MSEKYKDLTTQGEHRGGAAEHESGSNVRAPEPPDESSAENAPVEQTYQLIRHTESGYYKLRAQTKAASSSPEPGYAELGRYTTHEELNKALSDVEDQIQFVVFENTESGEVFFDREKNISGDWTGDGRFDQVNFFDDESAAASYAETRREALRKE